LCKRGANWDVVLRCL
nr:immunoglobulin heavy chain junction region [Mus musculus]